MAKRLWGVLGIVTATAILGWYWLPHWQIAMLVRSSGARDVLQTAPVEHNINSDIPVGSSRIARQGISFISPWGEPVSEKGKQLTQLTFADETTLLLTSIDGSTITEELPAYYRALNKQIEANHVGLTMGENFATYRTIAESTPQALNWSSTRSQAVAQYLLLVYKAYASPGLPRFVFHTSRLDGIQWDDETPTIMLFKRTDGAKLVELHLKGPSITQTTLDRFLASILLEPE